MYHVDSPIGISKDQELAPWLDALSVEASQALDPNGRATRGQFFTSHAIAQLMTSMFGERPRTLSILDAGAGIGTLSFLLAVEACAWDPRPLAITVTAYENEPLLCDYLHRVYAKSKELCAGAGIAFEARIIQRDFVEVATEELQGGLFATGVPPFNAAILNPPYRKLGTNSSVSRMLRHAGIETTNLYAAFVWLAARLLQPRGELVAITPRSFCNGPYFRQFRSALLDSLSLRTVHVFEARDRAFERDKVLQENIIFHAAKEIQQPTVTITSSHDPDDPMAEMRQVSFSQIVHPNDPERYWHIVTDDHGRDVSAQARSLETSLDDLGLSVSTGKVVDFRVAHCLRYAAEPETVPLLYPLHMADGRIRWPDGRGKKPEYLKLGESKDELTVPTGWYVLVKRFTSKEERRRLVAAVSDPHQIPSDQLAIENHLNYFHERGAGMPSELAVGLAAFLNSTLLDEYFRQFSGHTQVNATDLRNIRYPTREQLTAIGKSLGASTFDQEKLDSLVTETLGMAQSSPAVRKKKMIEDAMKIMRALDVPRAQLNQRSALTLLAMLDLKPGDKWRSATDPLYGITEMMDYFRDHFGVTYAPNTRETVRRFTVHQFMQMGLVVANPDEPARPINSPKTRYQIEPALLEVIRSFGAKEWDGKLRAYRKSASQLLMLHDSERSLPLIPIALPDGTEVRLSAGGQNVLIKQIVEEFCARYTPGAQLLYLGDAGNKRKIHAKDALARLGVLTDEHGKMPDVIVYVASRRWLVLIEAATSHGPIDLKRHNELKELFSGSKVPLVFVTAFPTRSVMVKYLRNIAWETDVWVADSPSHLIHFNGERFLGPYEYDTDQVKSPRSGSQPKRRSAKLRKK